MTTDFKKLWNDPNTPNRERKRLLANIIDDATLIKLPMEGITRIHVRFKGGKTETLTTLNPKSSAQQVKTTPNIVELVDKLLDTHIYSEIADILNQQGLRPGGSVRPGRSSDRFTALRVAYLVHRYSLRSRYSRSKRQSDYRNHCESKRLSQTSEGIRRSFTSVSINGNFSTSDRQLFANNMLIDDSLGLRAIC